MRPSRGLNFLNHTRRLVHANKSSLLSTLALFSGRRDFHVNNIQLNMRVTRSATRKAATVDANGTAVEESVVVVSKTNGKRAANADSKQSAKRTRTAKTTSTTLEDEEQKTAHAPRAPVIPITPIPAADGEELVPAVLTFSFESAKDHLISVDPRFEEMFKRVSCRPFEHLERVDPFRCVTVHCGRM